jgi:hypothetical protein
LSSLTRALPQSQQRKKKQKNTASTNAEGVGPSRRQDDFDYNLPFPGNVKKLTEALSY